MGGCGRVSSVELRFKRKEAAVLGSGPWSTLLQTNHPSSTIHADHIEHRPLMQESTQSSMYAKLLAVEYAFQLFGSAVVYVPALCWFLWKPSCRVRLQASTLSPVGITSCMTLQLS
jgi:hypothetical protein